MNTDKLWEEYKQLTHAGVYESMEESREHFDWWIKKLEEQEAGHRKDIAEAHHEGYKIGYQTGREHQINGTIVTMD